MRFLLDTHILVWLTSDSRRIPASVLSLLAEPTSELLFSDVSLWEVAIKISMGRLHFQINTKELRKALLEYGYQELNILSDHIFAVETLPLIHKDPFDRLLIAQAAAEGVTLLTNDHLVAKYPGPIQKI